jgi:hypothetical protein
MVAGIAVAAACGGGDDGATPDDDQGPSGIEVVISDDTSNIARLRDVTCRRVDDTQLVASGVVSSSGDATHYVNLQVRFVDGDGVRVELATDSVSDLLVGEAARWDATTYADGAAEVRRCEVTATVS